VRAILGGVLLVALATEPVRGYEPEPDLPRGEWLLLEGRTEEAVRWYRKQYAEDPSPEWREGLAEALTAYGTDLLGRQRPVEALLALEEAERLARDAERVDRIRHLIAYAEKRSTGHAVFRGHRALAHGDLDLALAEYRKALDDAHDDYERHQSRTLLTYLLLLRATVDSDAAPAAEQAAETWPGEEAGTTEDAEQFLWAARGRGALESPLRDALERLDGDGGERSSALRTLAFCLLLRTGEAARAFPAVRRPEWREPLLVLMSVATRMEDDL
jgi:tetratricopeptide (TPR) repeat protein